MKILNIHDYPPTEGGGVEVNVSRVGMELVNKGVEYKILTSRSSSAVLVGNSQAKEFTVNGVQVRVINRLNELRKEIDSADIVNIHLSFSLRPLTMMAIDLCSELNRKAIVTFRTTYKHIPFSSLGNLSPIEREYRLSTLSRMLNKDNFTLSAPAECLSDTLRALGVSKKLNVVRNGISGIGANIISDSNINIGTPDISEVDITYIGNISILKNVESLIVVFAKLIKQLPNLKLRIIGNGESMNDILKKIEYFQLEENVEVLGYVQNSSIPLYLAKTKILVHPSLSESWCNTIAEALAQGVPVIATNVEGIAELTRGGEFANLVTPGDSESLYLGIINVLTNKDELGILKNKALLGQQFVCSNYTFENQANNLLKLYNSIL